MEGCYAVYSGTWQCFWAGVIIFFVLGIFLAGGIERDLGFPKELGILCSIVSIVFSLVMLFGLVLKCGYML